MMKVIFEMKEKECHAFKKFCKENGRTIKGTLLLAIREYIKKEVKKNGSVRTK